MRKFDVARPWAKKQTQAPPAAVEARTPSRPADLVADLLVPIGQALTTGALLGGLVAFVAARTDYEGDLWALWLGVTLTVATLAWVLLLFDTRRLLWALEKVTGLDLDNSGEVGKPQERLVVVNAARGQQEAQEQANRERASQFARFVAALPIRGTDTRTWEKELGRDTYQEYRDALIRIGWARWCSTKKDGTPNERRGWELTTDPAEILKRISG